jgi:tripartite-type tricarboxylate transporter receptor subunit TctC
MNFKALVLTVALAALHAGGFAQDLSGRSVQILVPFAAGGSTDITARALAKAMEKDLNTPVVVVNKPGAGGTIALAEVARAKPDGHVLGVFLAANAAIAPHIQKSVPYDPLKDFTPIATYAVSTIYLAVRADSPYKTLDDVMNDMKARPGKVVVGITTLGSSTHLATARLARERGLQTDFVTFNGGAQVITALLGGHIPVAAVAGEIYPHVVAGKLRFIASYQKASIPALTNVPSIDANGFNWEADSWVGMAGPAGMSEDLRAKLEASVLKATSDPEYKRVLAEMAMVPRLENGRQLRATLEKSHKDVGALVKAIGLTAQ